MNDDTYNSNFYKDWNSLYENEWPSPPVTFSKKWAWHHSQRPYIAMLPQFTQNRPYKYSGPRSKYSTMYKKLYPTPCYDTEYVTEFASL